MARTYVTDLPQDNAIGELHICLLSSVGEAVFLREHGMETSSNREAESLSR